MVRILLVEDDKVVAKIIKYYLCDEYEVVWAKTGGEAQACARESFDTILMDILLPDVNGIELCAYLRKWHKCPIIFISCLDNAETIIEALENGGDDFITKPFDNKVLKAYIQANLRRAQLETAQAQAFTCSGFSLDSVRHVVIKNGRELRLPPTEYKILSLLMQNAGRYYSPTELYEAIWGQESYGDRGTVAVHIFSLRRKIEDDPKNPRYLKNIWGKGYIFDHSSNNAELNED